MNTVSRRHLLGYGGAALGGLLIGANAVSADESKASGKDWEYHRLDPALTAARGYAGYYAGRCCYGVFDAVNGALADKHGAPYDTFPSSMLAFGKSGVAGFGTLCGALNGAGAAIGLYVGAVNKKDPTSKARDKMITDLFSWYEKEALPVFKPTDALLASSKGKDCAVPATCAESVLCHRSVGVWCSKAECGASSKERSERCARLTADVAARTVELLNAHLAGEKPAAQLSAEAQTCLSCHGKGKELDNAKSKMNCAVCHSDDLGTMGPDHGSN